MSKDSTTASERDFTKGVPLEDIADEGILTGQVGDESVLLVRKGEALFAVGATCTHYGGPLADGLVVGETIRCPWHHAAFCLRTGQVEHAPALDGLKCWRVEQSGGRVFVREAQLAAPSAKAGHAKAKAPESVAIIGGGAAANAAAMTLRREGYEGPITLWSADASPPYDRPNLSKDYLAGTADPAWLPLRSPEFYAEQRIDVRCGQQVVTLDPANQEITLSGGTREHYGALLMATGAKPIRLAVPGAQLPHVMVLRSLADCDALIARLATVQRCVVVGAGFIGLEAAAALRTRGAQVHVVMRGAHPMERVLGPALGDMLKKLHESHGVVFHAGADVSEITANSVKLSSGDELPAELVVAGIGVDPEVALAQQAGLAIDRGVVVDEYLQTSAPHVYAAGDIARWPDVHTGTRIRVEHWVVAERQGAVAARNILGQQRRFDAVPFFWTQHYDIAVNYVGHAEGWDRVDIDGDPDVHACAATYWRGNKRLAVATVGRDLENLRAEAAFEAQT
ncbi:FAD-dependent oxidoreductase [Paraburkholderia tagetis]|uniref:FAD-dependent oxidoreductase n=1 Tax=Paraburkholderia tagetis TaxID=2913261 RepID=A0A9X1ULM1_9BURK|nr:FAD-dependent oxidoreductase [Paraburkholderia tagetis]MCG5077633.1 FAD-dependent oxidoreductase [Paraburkholderia tagetis]